MSNNSQYDQDYFLRGKESGKSLYSDYRWMPDLTIPMASTIAKHCGFSPEHNVVDFGCARGYTVRALRELGYKASGVDVSHWAFYNADPVAAPFMRLVSETWPDEDWPTDQPIDWIIAKDVLEHVHFVCNAISRLMRHAQQGIFAVVPLSLFPDGRYVIEDYEKDVTHCQRHTLRKWVEMFLHPGWSVQASYRLPGVKDNWWKLGWEMGNGFILAKRIAQ